MSDNIRVGLIGYGYASKTFHAPLIAGTPLDVPLFWALPRSAQTSLARLTNCVMRAAAEVLAPA